MDDLLFHVLLNSISVISGQLKGNNERLCAIKPILRLKWFLSQAGLELRTARSAGQCITYWAIVLLLGKETNWETLMCFPSLITLKFVEASTLSRQCIFYIRLHSVVQDKVSLTADIFFDIVGLFSCLCHAYQISDQVLVVLYQKDPMIVGHDHTSQRPFFFTA